MTDPIVYDNAIGTGVNHVAGTVRRDEWRVSWMYWPDWETLPPASAPSRGERITEDEAEARRQLVGLQGEKADHPMDGPCDVHVWEPKLERRTVWQSPWTEVEDGP